MRPTKIKRKKRQAQSTSFCFHPSLFVIKEKYFTSRFFNITKWLHKPQNLNFVLFSSVPSTFLGNQTDYKLKKIFHISILFLVIKRTDFNSTSIFIFTRHKLYYSNRNNQSTDFKFPFLFHSVPFLINQAGHKPNKAQKIKPKPDPLGRKSRPTMLSNTDDFPELCIHMKTYLK